MNFFYQVFAGTGADRLVWALDRSRLRILCYHGICEDTVAAAPWVPSFFVCRSDFATHLEYLKRNAHVLPLREAAARLRDGSLPPRAVALTFDDGFANNWNIAYPLLRDYAMPATVFLSTAYVESGDWFPFLKLKLVRKIAAQRGFVLPEYKSTPIGTIDAAVSELWEEVQPALTDEQRRTLEPMSIEQVRSADRNVMEFGAHTHRHCILRNETRERRREEIRTSLDKVAAWTGHHVAVFSYPNGQAGDFDAEDQRLLRELGVQVAVSGIAGANSSGADGLALRRYPVGLYHARQQFLAEVTGCRTALHAITKGVMR